MHPACYIRLEISEPIRTEEKLENFEKIAIGLVLFVLTSVVAYLFKMRQLYVALPKLFRHAPISKNGSLCEIIVYNKGNHVEENIQVVLDQDIKYELLASGSGGIALEGSILNIERLHKGCEASVMLLIENGTFDSTKITSISSKATEGSVLKKVTDVPPNYAIAFISLVLFLGFLPAMFYGFQAYENIHASYVRHQLKSAQDLGWNNLSKYYNSDLKKSYSNQEFPVRYLGPENAGGKQNMLNFEVYNKTAVMLEITGDKVGSSPSDIKNYATAKIPPMTKGRLSMVDPRGTNFSQTAELDFTFRNGEDFLYGIKFLVPAQ
jgi:hypothetical protein